MATVNGSSTSWKSSTAINIDLNLNTKEFRKAVSAKETKSKKQQENVLLTFLSLASNAFIKSSPIWFSILFLFTLFLCYFYNGTLVSSPSSVCDKHLVGFFVNKLLNMSLNCVSRILSICILICFCL